MPHPCGAAAWKWPNSRATCGCATTAVQPSQRWGVGYRGMTRRIFLGAMGVTGVLAKEGAPIRSVEVFPVNYPVTAYFKFLPKPGPPSVFVKIACEDGDRKSVV